MDQSWQGKQLTKASTPVGNLPAFPPNFGPIDTMEPLPQEPFSARIHIIFMTIIEITDMLFSNQLGWFPIMSNRGNKYVVIFYIYNTNFVKSIPIKSPTNEEFLPVYTLANAYLTACGFKLQLHKMDNKISYDVENLIRKECSRLKYTPPNIHRTNLAEREIWTCKNHFLSGITGLPKTFPIANWC